MNPEELKEMNEIRWWHNMSLDGAKTHGMDFTMDKLTIIRLPVDLKGKKVLDVGAWDGFFSFECERRGAEVLAIDTVMWKEGPTFDVGRNKEVYHTGKKGFDFAKKILKSKVESKKIEVVDISKETVGEFDVVLCLGIMYHMEEPFRMIKAMADVTKDLLILETHIDLTEIERPVLAFYPGKEVNNDPGTWFGPNPLCVEAMLKAAGFKEVEKVFQNNLVRRAVFHARK